ncbi:MAG: hypothetical protein A3J93_03510 [Candidatus Magasanikbacteria bacterium RIFOXYC2_FULL_42_28]|uniref:Uncharacterized protein n=1 Tax=Candidatus Magasanikbacteria bacterium RIFOXYC2_FULL_42_28 TaxID=1798704 RepID=A0A1F6NUH1_9BACT|nr:MAG: hypothetical protein A3J93_03510 [Candidatus Magasanikbacteria bacterium RIFOXYC2_FULL_42_28]
MPELPEVETVRRDLEKVLVGKKITAVEILDKKIVGGKPAVFVSAVNGKKIVGVERRGKLLAFKLSSGEYLLAHLKMTGQLICVSLSLRAKRGNLIAGGHQVGKNDLTVPNKFTRVIFAFSPPARGGARGGGSVGGTLYFNDLRRFGYLKVVSAEEKETIFKNNFGIEPLTPDFKLSAFTKIFRNRKTNLKAILMNQKLISGLGNIYVDEACFNAGLLPWRSAKSLKPPEIKKLFSCIQKVIAVAIKNRGTTFKDFRDGAGGRGAHYNFLNVYGRKGEKCRKCKNFIKKTKHAGRGTHFCPKCQR